MIRNLSKVTILATGIIILLLAVSPSISLAAPDSTAPGVVYLQPAWTLSTTSATLFAYYGDSESGVNTASVAVYLDGAAASGCTVSAISASCSVYGLANGAHTLAISLQDIAGNSATASTAFTVAIPVTYTDVNNAVIEVYSDSGYTIKVSENAQLAANANYYVQVKHPNMNLSSEGTDRNRMRLYSMTGSQVNFGDGTQDMTMTQQAGGAPYVYRATFRTPASANVYFLEPDLRNDAQTKRLYTRGWKMTVGATTSYVKLFTDATYATETSTYYSAAARVYMEVYGSGLTDGTPTTGSTTVTLSDFLGNSTTPAESVSKVSTRKYRVSFLLPGTNGDKGVRALISSGSVLAKPDVLIKIVPDGNAPAISNILPAGSINSTSATMSASYADSLSGIYVPSVSVKLDGVTRTGCSTNTSNVSCPVTGLGQGAHTMQISVADIAGNTSTSSGSFTVDTVAPAVSEVHPVGTIDTDAATISAAISEYGSGVNTDSVVVLVDGSALTGCSVSTSGVSCAKSGLTAGSHSIAVTVQDNAGNAGSGNGSFAVSLGASDTTPPAIISVAPSGYLGSSTAVLTAYYADEESGINTATAAVYLDGSALSGCTASAASVSCSISGLTAGAHTIDVTVEDQAGNTGTGSGSFTLSLDPGDDSTPPVITSIGPLGTIHGNSAAIVVYYGDTGSGINTGAVDITLDGVSVVGCLVTEAITTCDLSGLRPGQHTIGGSIPDISGNHQSISGSFVIARGYLWTWYDNRYARDWLLMANPASASQSAAFDLYIAGQPQDLSSLNNGVIHAGQSITPRYPDLIGGPVEVHSLNGNDAIVSQRIIWAQNSFEEVLGVDANRQSDHFYWTWYDEQSPTYKNWILVANNNPYPVYFEVSIAGAVVSSGNIPAGGNVTPRFAGVIGGPVEAQSWTDSGKSAPAKVMASQRTLLNNDAAFNESIGVAQEELSDHYLWTWYDSVSPGVRDWILVANPNDGPVYYRIDIAGGCTAPGPNAACTTGTLPAGGRVTPEFAGINNGPVDVQAWSDGVDGDVPAVVIASQRVTWGQSFSEIMGYPFEHLSTSYHWSWYDQQSPGMSNWVLVANPSASEAVYTEVWIGGQQMHEENNPAAPDRWVIPAGGRVTPRFGSYMNGPVEIRAYVAGGSWNNHADRRTVMASQRVLYNGFFNETLGTVLD